MPSSAPTARRRSSRGTVARRERRDRLPGPARQPHPDRRRRVRARLGHRAAARCACRSRSTPARRASRCAPNSPRRRSRARNWQFAVGGGWIVLDPLTAGRRGAGAQARRWCAARSIRSRQRITLDQGDFGTKEFGGRDAQGRQHRAVGQFRFRRRAAARARHRRQPDAGRRAQAAVAGVHRAQGARLGGAAHRQRHGRARRDRDQHDDGCDAAERAADSGRRAVDRHRRQRTW